jgi:hypothetical protein
MTEAACSPDGSRPIMLSHRLSVPSLAVSAFAFGEAEQPKAPLIINSKQPKQATISQGRWHSAISTLRLL